MFKKGTVENVFIISIWLLLLAFGRILSFNRSCLQICHHHPQSLTIIIFYILKQTQILVFIHISLKICYFRDVYWRFTKKILHCLHVIKSSSSSSSYSKTNTKFCVHTYSTICYFRSILQNSLSVTWIVF